MLVLMCGQSLFAVEDLCTDIASKSHREMFSLNVSIKVRGFLCRKLTVSAGPDLVATIRRKSLAHLALYFSIVILKQTV